MRKNLFYFIGSLLICCSCSQKQKDKSGSAKIEIMEADKAMNKMASAEGFNTALLHYAAEDVIKPKEGELAVIGKNNLTKYWEGKESTKAISWDPVIAEASPSGDMGYTFGKWKFPSGDTVFYGNYVTIWKKDKDGAWKFVYDGGNNTPQPK